MRILYLFNYIIVALLFLNSCKKDKVEVTPVPDYLQKMIPYKVGETIIYRNENGAIITATVEKESYISEQSACSGCPVAIRTEIIKCKLVTGGKRFIDFQLDNRPIVFLGIWSPLENYQTGGGFDFYVTEGISQPICNTSRQTCLPSVILNGTTYINVLEIYNGGTPDKISKAYYTVEKGVIGFRYSNGTTYSIL
jgi:hypothetical protein